MNAEGLLEVYEQISEAPDAIARLRRFVLDLAVRGKLVEQDVRDEPATHQLVRIAEAKSQLALKERKTKKKTVDPSLTEIAFDLPLGWDEARLSDLVRVVNGRAYKKSELLSEGTPVLRVGNLFTSDHWYYSDLELEDDKYCDEGDLIYAWSASFGPFIWRGPRAIFHYHIWKLPLFSETNLSKRFIYLFLQQKTREIKDAGHGISMIHMTKEKMEQLAVALPPLAEQHRIVAKVDELMALCDRLEEAGETREATRNKLTAASLARLTAPDTTAENFPTHANFALEALPALTTRPDQIKTLRQTILNLAVRGKLVEQDVRDEPATHQLVRIAEAKSQRALKERKTKKKTVDPSLTEIAFDLPLGWDEARLSDLVRVVNGRAYKKSELLSEGTPVLRVGNLFTSDHWYYSDLELEDDKYCDEGDLIYAWSASFGPFIWRGPRAIFHYHIWKLPLFSETNLSKRFIYLFLQQKTREIKDAGHGISMIHMTKEKMEQLAVALPPLAEQHRIVAKVDALMALCDRLEAALTTTDATRSRLLEALLHEALEPTAEAVTEAAE